MPNEIVQTGPSLLSVLGLTANHIASGSVFQDYRERKARNTLIRQDRCLRVFSSYLAEAGVSSGNLPLDADAWEGVTWGLIEGFKRWLLLKGFAVSSVNIMLSTVKTYSRLAAKAGKISPQDYVLIKAVEGYRRTEAKRIDKHRKVKRIGNKKSEPVSISPYQANHLKEQPNTPQGRRDKLLLCLLLDHGLRVGEVARISVGDIDLKNGLLTFYRPKVDKYQAHQMTADTTRILKSYLKHDALPSGLLLRSSRKGKGGLSSQGMTERSITDRVRVLGEGIGIHRLSAHDCRHYWATQAARNGTPIERLQDAGGWNSLAMPARYIEAEKIANEGIRLRGRGLKKS
jgi:integrase